MAKRILLTGGTGFIGSHIAARLLQNGHTIYFLARSDTRLSAEERVLHSMAPISRMPRNMYHVLEGDLTSNLNFKLSDIDEAWHCAASLSFKEEEEDRIDTLATNVGGTKNFLEFLSRIKVRRAYFISTAYARSSRVNNSYEESKVLAEQLFCRWGKEAGRVSIIYKPSIIVGDSKTGYASKFDGYYTCARGFHLILRLLERSKAKHNGSGPGIEKKNGIWRLPIYFPAIPGTNINLLPIDLAIDAIFGCSNVQHSDIFHITNATPIKVERLVDISMKIFGIQGVKTGMPPDDAGNQLLNQLNKQIAQAVKYYSPYICCGPSEPDFDQTSTVAVLGKVLSFPITETFVKTILDYAISVNFKG